MTEYTEVVPAQVRHSCKYTLKIHSVWRDAVNACGDTGDAKDSVGGDTPDLG